MCVQYSLLVMMLNPPSLPGAVGDARRWRWWWRWAQQAVGQLLLGLAGLLLLLLLGSSLGLLARHGSHHVRLAVGHVHDGHHVRHLAHHGRHGGHVAHRGHGHHGGPTSAAATAAHLTQHGP